MRVLKGKILVQTDAKGALLIQGDQKRRGTVAVTGSDQLKVGDEVLFGNECETVSDNDKGSALILMSEENVKIIYEGDK